MRIMRALSAFLAGVVLAAGLAACGGSSSSSLGCSDQDRFFLYDDKGGSDLDDIGYLAFDHADWTSCQGKVDLSVVEPDGDEEQAPVFYLDEANYDGSGPGHWAILWASYRYGKYRQYATYKKSKKYKGSKDAIKRDAKGYHPAPYTVTHVPVGSQPTGIPAPIATQPRQTPASAPSTATSVPSPRYTAPTSTAPKPAPAPAPAPKKCRVVKKRLVC